MNIILSIPLGVRLTCLFVLGAVVAGLVNLATYRLAWRQRSISPWSPPPSGVAARQWCDRLPLIGWWCLRRESSVHGRGFWLRPLAVEIAAGLLFVGLYLGDFVWSQPLVLNVPPPRADFLSANVALVLHVRFFSHLLLVSLMLVASLIDLDEKTIPDAITIPGALAALALAAVYPWSLLPAADWVAVDVPRQIEFLSLVSPEPWPAALDGWPVVPGLIIALGCWTLWCGGLLPRRWNTRRGLSLAVRVFIHRLRIEAITYWILAMWLAGAVAIAIASFHAPPANWAGLLTALVGLAGGGGVVWLVRVVGSAALEREAMGFGDVTLMSMIGAFLGWQPALMIFFMAPFVALVLAVIQRIAHGEQEIPYGPFLCLAALVLVFQWVPIWQGAHTTFATGWLLPSLLVVCLALMGVMLWVYRVATAVEPSD